MPSGGPPVICKNTTLYMFFAAGDDAALKTLCYDVFTKPSNNVVKCENLGNQVMLIVGKIGWLGTETSPVGVQEDQVVLQVPVRITIGNAKTLAWFSPLTIVNNPISLVGGREVFGFAKSYGAVTFPADLNASSLAVQAFGANDADQFASLRDLIDIDQTGVALPHLGENPLSLFNPTAGDLDADFLTLLDDWVAGGVAQVFLKQFPRVDNGSQACLLQITKATYSFAATPVLTYLPFNYHLKVTHLDSHDIGDKLGIADQTISGGFRADCDFKFDQGKVLWP
jgi:hypothetical protein